MVICGHCGFWLSVRLVPKLNEGETSMNNKNVWLSTLFWLLIGSFCSQSSQALLASNLPNSCRCACVEGLPQTLCRSVEAAQAQLWVCPPSHRCPVPSAPGNLDRPLQAPHPQAENCRAVRVWHRQRQAYTGVNICDVQSPDNSYTD